MSSKIAEENLTMASYEIIEAADARGFPLSEVGSSGLSHGSAMGGGVDTHTKDKSNSITQQDLCDKFDSECEGEDNEDDDDDDESTGIDVWEFVGTEVHTILLKELWRATETAELEKILCKLLNVTTEKVSSIRKVRTIFDMRVSIQRETKIFYTLGGYSILVGIMVKFSESERVLSKCFQLFSLLCHDSTLHGSLIQHSVYAGAIESILQSMQNFLPVLGEEMLASSSNNDTKIRMLEFQSEGLEALSSLTYDEYDNAKRVIDFRSTTTSGECRVGGVGIVLNVMKQCQTVTDSHLSNMCKRAILAGCHVLLNLTYIDFNQYLIDSGAITTLGAAMELPQDDSGIHETAREAISEMI